MSESEFKRLTDFDPMPFGKYGPKYGEALSMQDVPAKYLFWLWTEGALQKEIETTPPFSSRNAAVADYIRRNLSTLETEHTDGIWR